MDINAPVSVHLATAQHMCDMIRLERQSSTAAHWSEQEYERLFATQDKGKTRLALVAHSALPGHPKVETWQFAGFLIALCLGPEWELENIVVADYARGKGAGTRLLQELLARAQSANCRSVFLEVRESNGAARALYSKLGFQESGRRKSYYSNPLEDAIQYTRQLVPDPVSP